MGGIALAYQEETSVPELAEYIGDMANDWRKWPRLRIARLWPIISKWQCLRRSGLAKTLGLH
jgi:hypothetical protein